MINPENKTMVTRSFRVSRDSIDLLEEAAREKNVSVNSLVNEIIDRFVDLEFPARGMRLKLVNPSLFRFLMEQAPRDKLIEFAKDFALNSIAGGVVKTSPGISEEGLVSVMKRHCKYNALNFVETARESKRVITIVHDIGMNESYFVGTYYKSLFDAIGVKVNYLLDDKAVVFHFG